MYNANIHNVCGQGKTHAGREKMEDNRLGKKQKQKQRAAVRKDLLAEKKSEDRQASGPTKAMRNRTIKTA
jgi:hypothetical protein